MQTNLLALMPCPLKIPFEQKISMYMQEHRDKQPTRVDYHIVSNATQQLTFFADLAQCDNPDELPDIVMAPGFSGFFFRRFIDRFINTGVFRYTLPFAANADLADIGIPDVNQQYTIPCFNPTVLVVDRTAQRDLPIPETWSDLLKPEYTGLLALRGHSDEDFCEGILLNIYKENDLDAVAKLGRAVKTGLHPSQMVKYIGSGQIDAPAVSAMPYAFAQLVKDKKNTTLVWPRDGAIVNPLVMLVKAAAKPHIHALADYIVGAEIGAIFADAYFPSAHPAVDNHLPEGATFKWLGWDFLKTNDIQQLKEQVNQVFVESFRSAGE